MYVLSSRDWEAVVPARSSLVAVDVIFLSVLLGSRIVSLDFLGVLMELSGEILPALILYPFCVILILRQYYTSAALPLLIFMSTLTQQQR